MKKIDELRDKISKVVSREEQEIQRQWGPYFKTITQKIMADVVNPDYSNTLVPDGDYETEPSFVSYKKVEENVYQFGRIRAALIAHVLKELLCFGFDESQIVVKVYKEKNPTAYILKVIIYLTQEE